MEVLVLQRAARLLGDLPSHLPATHDWVLPELWLACYLLLIPVFASVTFAPHICVSNFTDCSYFCSFSREG